MRQGNAEDLVVNVENNRHHHRAPTKNRNACGPSDLPTFILMCRRHPCIAIATDTLLKRLGTASVKIKADSARKIGFLDTIGRLFIHGNDYGTSFALENGIRLTKWNTPHEMKVASVNNSPSSVFSTPSILTVMESFFLGEYLAFVSWAK